MSMSVRWEATREFVQRYRQIFQHVWAQRGQLDSPHRLNHELQFLPAALALQETPVHPAPRYIMWIILSFAALALLWAIFGKVDIVATAQGKIIPNDRTKVIQPFETAVIKHIHVHDGQAVKAGDVLVELDATIAQADTDRTQSDWQQTQFDAARAQALLDAIDHHSPTATMRDPLDGVAHDQYLAAQRFLEGEYTEYRAKLQQLDATLAQNQAERRATLENQHKLEATLPIATLRSSDMKSLLDKNYVGRHEYLEKEQQRIEMERDLEATKAKLAELDAVILNTQRQRESFTAETRRTHLDQLHETEQKRSGFHQEFIKAMGRREGMTLTAPVDGTVQQLAIHTIGGVVTPAQQLMVVVPNGNALEVEAFVQNKDIGFVNSGQEAQVKIETFPFTKYGAIRGTVLTISNDAIQEDARQATSPRETSAGNNVEKAQGSGALVYAARVQLKNNTLQVEGKTVNLSPGMAVTVEIKTGKRRLIEYFLSPLMQYKDESLRER